MTLCVMRQLSCSKSVRGRRMKKIPTLFVRDPDDRKHVLNEVTEGCEWVMAGQGVPTRKYNGTCVMLDFEGGWWTRREVKQDTTVPALFLVVNYDETTGKTIGWEPAQQSGFWKYLVEAIGAEHHIPGAYELIGPKINGNPEQLHRHVLIEHYSLIYQDRDEFGSLVLSYEGLRDWLTSRSWEGIVWHHEDGRMAKLKRKDFV